MKWIADQDPSPRNWAKGETGKWKMVRAHRQWPALWTDIAFVERADAAPLIGEPSRYRARVVFGRWFVAPELYGTLADAQRWCEAEVRLREIGELA